MAARARAELRINRGRTQRRETEGKRSDGYSNALGTTHPTGRGKEGACKSENADGRFRLGRKIFLDCGETPEAPTLSKRLWGACMSEARVREILRQVQPLAAEYYQPRRCR
jgi:hypothetical protein